MSEKTMRVNPDLQKERDTCNFNVKELSAVLYGGEAQLERKQKLGNYISKRLKYCFKA